VAESTNLLLFLKGIQFDDGMGIDVSKNLLLEIVEKNIKDIEKNA